jgi:hypothetical protein
MKCLKELRELKKEFEEHTEELEKESRKKLDEEEIEKIENGPGISRYPGNTREQHLLYFYTLRTEDVENALKSLKNIDTAKIEEKISNVKEQTARNLIEEPENANKQSRASRSLRRAVKAIEGKEPQQFNERKYETSEIYSENQENRMFDQKRKEVVDAFLSASGLIGEKLPYRKQLQHLKRTQDADLKQADRYTEKINSIRDDMRKRAEVINQSIKRASYNLKEAEK